MKRSYEKITKADLRKLLRLEREDLDQFFHRNPSYKAYRRKVKLIALCQGAALHYLDGTNGVKDFDVWAFYPKLTSPLPYRRRGVVDFGRSKFGHHPAKHGFLGRSVDILMRSDSSFDARHPEVGLTDYLSASKSASAKVLAKKAVIGLYPDQLFGEILWPSGI